MTHVHQQPSTVDYRLRLPRSIHYAIAAMHHMGGAEDRRRAMEEIVRVLKPGGKIAICDLTAVIGGCEQALHCGDLINVRRHSFMHLFSILSAQKP